MSQQTFEIPVRHLMEKLGQESQGPVQLQQVLTQLSRLTLDEASLPPREAGTWQRCHLLSRLELKDDLLQFAFTEPVVQLLQAKQLSPQHLLLEQVEEWGRA